MKNLVNQISHKLYIFSKIRRFFSNKAALNVYKTMILPYFDYGDVVFMFSSESMLKKLDRLHLRGLRISENINNSFPKDDLLELCNISSLCNRRLVHLRNFMFNRKHLCENQPNIQNDSLSQICTRSKAGPTFNIVKPNCELYKRSICYSGCLEWNNLDSTSRNIENVFEFKKNQKTWLINTYKS